MNKKFCYLFTALPLVATLAACATMTPQTKTSLWEISSAHRTAYIASDTLSLSAGDFPLPAPFTKAFAASNELYVEQIPDTSRKSQAKIHSLIMKHGVLTENKTLEDVLTPAQLAAVKIVAKKKGQPFSHLKHLRPWLLALALGGAPAPHSKHPAKPQQQLTGDFYEKAKARSIPVRPFESDAKLFDIASSLPMKAQIKWLMHVIKPYEGNHDPHAKTRRLIKAWRAGNTATVLALSGGDFQNMPEVRQALVVNRNQAWVEVLEGELHTQGKPIFVVVGDGHLMGQDNMLSLLQKDGFRVRQL